MTARHFVADPQCLVPVNQEGLQPACDYVVDCIATLMRVNAARSSLCE
jgi:hypothetical protein